MQSWLLIGIKKNWEKALSEPIPIWGLRTSFQPYFDSIEIGDLLWFYSTSPVSGVIGLGAVKDKYIDNTNLIWPKEIENHRVLWPLRFRIQVLKILPKFRWKDYNIKINDFELFWQTSLHLLNEKQLNELLKRAVESLGVINLENIYAGASISAAEKVNDKDSQFGEIIEKKYELSHTGIKNQIAEIGKLQSYYSEVEYPILLPNEKKNLDVIWKRELEGVPTYAFEIELSGMLEKAVDRLVIAFKKWNSRPRIIIPGDYSNKLKNVIDLTDRDFYTQLNFYLPEQIVELYNLKTGLKGLEQKLELY